MNNLPLFLIFAGIILIFLGTIFYFGGKYINLGRLPGDIVIDKPGFKFYFPLTSCILISLFFIVLFVIYRLIFKV